VYVTEESAALFQSATDEHWGAGCSKLMEAVSVHAFDRHFQIARTTAFRGDMLLVASVEWFVAEKTGNVQHCIDINDRKYQTMESYMRAAPSPGLEVSYFLLARSSFVGVEAYHQHLQPRQNILRLLEYTGINNTQQAEEGYRSAAEWAFSRSISRSSADGISHSSPEHAMVAGLRALLSFSVDARNVDLSWLDDLPPADETTLYDISMSNIVLTTARVLVAEVFEQQGRPADAIRFAQTDLQDYHNFNIVSKVRAGRLLGRCHAALGQHTLAVSAFDAAIELAQSRKLLLSEALSVRGRAAEGRNGAGGGGLHWDEVTGKQRLAEVIGRMQGPREALERALLLPQ
jgi:tetratricopeptide (TPR) repeat protein